MRTDRIEWDKLFLFDGGYRIQGHYVEAMLVTVEV